MPRSTRLLLAFAVVSPLLGTVIAQQAQQAPQELQDAVAELAVQARRAHGSAVLKAAGVAALPALRAMMTKVGSEHDPDPDAVLAALFAVQRLGGQAVSAMPEVRQVYGLASDLRLRNQAMWTLACLAATTCDNTTIEATGEALRRDYTRDLDSDTMQTAFLRMTLGNSPAAGVLQGYLQNGWSMATAAAACIADNPRSFEDLDETMRSELATALDRPCELWTKDWHGDAATGYLAFALYQHGNVDANTTRGLLMHWDPEVRGLGLAALNDMKQLSAYERLDIVMRLWDPERSVCDQAVANLHTQGVHGIVGLRALRAFERDPLTGARAIVFRRAADSVLAACCQGATPNAAALLHDADRILHGEHDVVPSQPADADGTARFAELIVGCRGADDDTLPLLARLAHDAKALQTGSGSALAKAFVSCFATWSEPAWNQVARALAELGPASIHHLQEPVETVLQARYCYGFASSSTCGFIVEGAICAGRHATEIDLRAAIPSRRWHLALMATAELVQRGKLMNLDAPALRLLATTKYETVSATRAGSGSARVEWMPNSVLLRAMTAVAMTQIGEDPWSIHGLTEATAREFEVEEDQVADFLLTSKNAGKLPELARRIVADASAEFPIFLPK